MLKRKPGRRLSPILGQDGKNLRAPVIGPRPVMLEFFAYETRGMSPGHIGGLAPKTSGPSLIQASPEAYSSSEHREWG